MMVAEKAAEMILEDAQAGGAQAREAAKAIAAAHQVCLKKPAVACTS